MVMYFQAFQRGQSYLREMMAGLARIYEDNLFLSDLHEFLDLKPKVAEPPRPAPFPQPIKSGIVFDRVSFHYPNDGREVLKNVSLTIEPGETVALVGENGSGKTTLIKLLCRLYDPTAGNIAVDGIDLRNYSAAALRREIGVIFQDYSHYNLTARENIWLGNVELPADDDRIALAAQQAGAHEVIQKLPESYQTVLGYWFEKGTELSVGEWQKIALSRAFLRDAQLIVLDEPTSAIDAKAEYEFFQKFRQLTKGRAVILVSHRLSTVRLANRIYVLAGGAIAEAGTHDQLIHCGGAYARLYEMQAQRYR
jgi:ATP-binding cassette subfamily B protein